MCACAYSVIHVDFLNPHKFYMCSQPFNYLVVFMMSLIVDQGCCKNLPLSKELVQLLLPSNVGYCPIWKLTISMRRIIVLGIYWDVVHPIKEPSLLDVNRLNYLDVFHLIIASQARQWYFLSSNFLQWMDIYGYISFHRVYWPLLLISEMHFLFCYSS